MRIGVARWDKGALSPKFLAYLVVSCFVRRGLTPNTVARLKPKIFGPSQNLGLATLLVMQSIFTVLASSL